MSDRTLRTATALLVGAIAALAFLVSFDAIATYAAQVGAFPRSLRWCAPLLVDTFTIAACLVILARSRDGARAVYAWTLVAVASGVSVALNIAHAPAHPSARLVAALPPAALLASLELTMSEARRLRGRSAAQTAPTSREVVRGLLTEHGQDLDAERVMAATGVGRRRAYELLAQTRAESNGDGSGS